MCIRDSSTAAEHPRSQPVEEPPRLRDWRLRVAAAREDEEWRVPRRRGGVAVVALAHGIKDDAVAAHAFFGTERVVAALATLPGFAQGRVVLGDGAFLRLDARVVAVDSARVVVPPVVRA